MLRTARALILCCGFIAAFAAPAAADWHLTPFAGLTFAGTTTLVDLEFAADNVHWNFGGAAMLLGDRPIGVEAYFVYVPGFFEADDASIPVVAASRSLALMGNLVLAAPARWNRYGLRPFVSGGVGLLYASQQHQTADVYYREGLLGFNVGGGAIGFLTDRTGLRFDLRYFGNLRPSDPEGTSIGRLQLRYWTTSVGVVLRY